MLNRFSADVLRFSFVAFCCLYESIRFKCLHPRSDARVDGFWLRHLHKFTSRTSPPSTDRKSFNQAVQVSAGILICHSSSVFLETFSRRRCWLHSGREQSLGKLAPGRRVGRGGANKSFWIKSTFRALAAFFRISFFPRLIFMTVDSALI